MTAIWNPFMSTINISIQITNTTNISRSNYDTTNNNIENFLNQQIPDKTDRFFKDS